MTHTGYHRRWPKSDKEGNRRLKSMSGPKKKKRNKKKFNKRKVSK